MTELEFSKTIAIEPKSFRKLIQKPEIETEHNIIYRDGYAVCNNCGLVIGKHYVDENKGKKIHTGQFTNFFTLGSHIGYKDDFIHSIAKDIKNNIIPNKRFQTFKKLKRQYDIPAKREERTRTFRRFAGYLSKVANSDYLAKLRPYQEQINYLFKKFLQKLPSNRNLTLKYYLFTIYLFTTENELAITLEELIDAFRPYNLRISEKAVLRAGIVFQKLFPARKIKHKDCFLYFLRHLENITDHLEVRERLIKKGIARYEYIRETKKKCEKVADSLSWKCSSRNQYNLAGTIIYLVDRKDKKYSLKLTQKIVAEALEISVSSISTLYYSFLKKEYNGD